jgi:hypothetical protein
MVSTAPFSDGPVYLPHRSASLPMIPFSAGVLLTKTRAFLNRKPQQLTLLSKTINKSSNHQDMIRKYVNEHVFVKYIQSNITYIKEEKKVFNQGSMKLDKKYAITEIYCLVYLLVISTLLIVFSLGNAIWSQGWSSSTSE